MTDTERITKAADMAQAAAPRQRDKINAAIANFQKCQQNAIEQPHKDWTARELEVARKRIDLLLEQGS